MVIWSRTSSQCNINHTKIACINQSKTTNLIMSEEFDMLSAVYKHFIGKSKLTCYFKHRSSSTQWIFCTAFHTVFLQPSSRIQWIRDTDSILIFQPWPQKPSEFTVRLPPLICLLFRLILFQHSVASAKHRVPHHFHRYIVGRWISICFCHIISLWIYINVFFQYAIAELCMKKALSFGCCPDIMISIF